MFVRTFRETFTKYAEKTKFVMLLYNKNKNVHCNFYEFSVSIKLILLLNLVLIFLVNL